MASSLIDETLDFLTRESMSSVLEREQSCFDQAAREFRDRLIIFGAGELGRAVGHHLIKIGYAPRFYADNDPRRCGSKILDVPILSTTDAVERYSNSACFIVAIYNGSIVRRQLRDLGCKTVLHFAPIFWKYPNGRIQAEAIGCPSRVLKNIESIYEAYSCLADDKSRYVFCEQLRWRVLLNSESMEPPSPTSQLYVAPELISSSDNDVFVDCGAFDGDSIRQFLTHNCNKFRQIIALEPDSANFNKLRSWVNHLPVSVGSRITILPYALGEKRQKVQFDEGNLVGSRITKVDSDGGTDCAPLDEIVAHHKPTFIKMDIEGAEPHAILGARTVLTQHQPVLAACVYHKSEHLWQLPSLIHSISRSHEIYLRRYAEDCWELVCYAVPQHRIPTPSTY